MPRTSLALRTLRVKPRKSEYAGSIDDVDGTHIMAHLGAFLHTCRSTPIKDGERNRFVRVHKVIARGRSLTVVTESGVWGEDGATWHVETNQKTHTRTAMEAATTRSRTTFWCPPRTSIILVSYEIRGGAIPGSFLLDTFRKLMRREYDTLYFPSDPQFEKSAWAKTGKLTEVSVVTSERRLDLSDGSRESDTAEKVLGRLVYTALPPKGQAAWPKKVWRKLREGSVSASSFVGLTHEDPDKSADESAVVMVTVARDGRQKKFELGTDGVPAIRMQLTDHSEPVLTDAAFHREVDERAEEFYASQKLEWSNRWLTRKAADRWKKHRDDSFVERIEAMAAPTVDSAPNP